MTNSVLLHKIFCMQVYLALVVVFGALLCLGASGEQDLYGVFGLTRSSFSSDALKKEYPSFDDQRLFELGVLVVSALIAKIHTVEWTPAIVFGYLVLIMVFKPSGLLGEQTREAG